jgi:hypothetical protein
MATAALSSEQHFVLPDVDWRTYCGLLRAFAKRRGSGSSTIVECLNS